MTKAMIVALLVASAAAKGLRSQDSILGEISHTEVFPMQTYKNDCWKKIPVSRTAGSFVQDPGAGILGKKFEPYETVMKDGFMMMDCVQDEMLLHGDKFGANKHDYKMGDSHNVSIVYYNDHVAKEDRKDMTQKICFEFCRTVPNMLFFGITNGRECYCEPFYNMMAGDSSECDATCEGDPSMMCGGKTKSSIFSMHFCDSTGEDLGKAKTKATDLAGEMKDLVKEATDIAETMTKSGEKNQKTFGKAGDLAAGDLMQKAKMYGGDVEKAAASTDKIKKALKGLAEDASKLDDFTKPDQVTKAERIMEDIEKTVAEGVVSVKALEEVLATVQPGPVTKNAAGQYLPLMYFVDKKFQDVPQTCDGMPVDKPISGLDMDGCASACDAANDGKEFCVGFAYFDTAKEDDRLCFLFSKFKTATYYTGCKSFLQDAKSDGKVTCVAKLTEFEGQNLSVDKSGKCKNCLKKLTNADRCY
jgi:hypothetical protein